MEVIIVVPFAPPPPPHDHGLFLLPLQNIERSKVISKMTIMPLGLQSLKYVPLKPMLMPLKLISLSLCHSTYITKT
jgi:hypothetical protein